MLNGLVDHVDDTALLEEMANIGKVHFLGILTEGSMFLVSHHSVFRVYPELDIPEIDLAVPEVIIGGINEGC